MGRGDTLSHCKIEDWSLQDFNGVEAAGGRIHVLDAEAREMLAFGPDGTLELRSAFPKPPKEEMFGGLLLQGHPGGTYSGQIPHSPLKRGPGGQLFLPLVWRGLPVDSLPAQ